MRTMASSVSPPSYELVAAGDSDPQLSIPVCPPTTLARSESADVVVADPRVSRRHARLEWVSNGLIPVDLRSRNGTSFNGERVTAPIVVWIGDEIRLGETRLLLRRRAQSTQANGAPRTHAPGTAE